MAKTTKKGSKKGKKKFAFDMTNVESGTSFSPIPEGDYLVKIVEFEETTASTGSTGIRFTFEVVEGKYKARKVFVNCWDSEKARFKMKQLFEAIGFEFTERDGNVYAEFYEGDLIGDECIGHVIITTSETNGKEYNDIQYFNPVDDEDEDDEESEYEDDDDDDEDSEEDDDTDDDEEDDDESDSDDDDDEDSNEEDEEEEPTLDELLESQTDETLKEICKKLKITVTKKQNGSDMIDMIIDYVGTNGKKEKKVLEMLPEEDDDEDDEPGYEDMEIDELKALCKERKIKLKKGLKKADLVRMLEADDEEE